EVVGEAGSEPKPIAPCERAVEGQDGGQRRGRARLSGDEARVHFGEGGAAIVVVEGDRRTDTPLCVDLGQPKPVGLPTYPVLGLAGPREAIERDPLPIRGDGLALVPRSRPYELLHRLDP